MKKARELVADRLRGIRAEKKYSIEDVASMAIVNKDTISRYENNLVSQQIDILEKVLDVYGLDFNIFFKQIYANKQRNDKKESE